VKLSANHTNLSQECAQQSSLKIVPNCIEIRAQKIVLYNPRFSYPLVVRTLLKNSCQLSMSRFLCRSCCTTALKFVPTLHQKSIVRPPRFLCPFLLYDLTKNPYYTALCSLYSLPQILCCPFALECMPILNNFLLFSSSTSFLSSALQIS
jgi:hypothetical protein